MGQGMWGPYVSVLGLPTRKQTLHSGLFCVIGFGDPVLDQQILLRRWIQAGPARWV